MERSAQACPQPRVLLIGLRAGDTFINGGGPHRECSCWPMPNLAADFPRNPSGSLGRKRSRCTSAETADLSDIFRAISRTPRAVCRKRLRSICDAGGAADMEERELPASEFRLVRDLPKSCACHQADRVFHSLAQHRTPSDDHLSACSGPLALPRLQAQLRHKLSIPCHVVARMPPGRQACRSCC